MELISPYLGQAVKFTKCCIVKRHGYLYFYGLPVAAVKMTIEAAELNELNLQFTILLLLAVFAFAAFLIVKVWYFAKYVCVWSYC